MPMTTDRFNNPDPNKFVQITFRTNEPSSTSIIFEDLDRSMLVHAIGVIINGREYNEALLLVGAKYNDPETGQPMRGSAIQLGPPSEPLLWLNPDEHTELFQGGLENADKWWENPRRLAQYAQHERAVMESVTQRLGKTATSNTNPNE